MAIRDLASGRSDVYKVPFNNVRLADGWNSRTEANTLANAERLLPSIVANGVREPLKGYVDTVDGVEYMVVTNGYSRYTAVSLGVERGEIDPESFVFPVILEPKNSDPVDRLATQIISNDGEQLTLYEQGINFLKMKAANPELTNAGIAKKIGKSEMHISNCLALHDAPEEVKAIVRDGVVDGVPVSQSTVIEAMRSHGEDALEVLEDAAKIAKSNGRKRVTAKSVNEATNTDKPSNVTTLERPKQQKSKLPQVTATSLLESLKDFYGKSYEMDGKIYHQLDVPDHIWLQIKEFLPF